MVIFIDIFAVIFIIMFVVIFIVVFVVLFIIKFIVILILRFGNLYGDFWLGNYYINKLTMQDEYRVKIELTNWKGAVNAYFYNKFFVESRSKQYRLNIGK